MESHIIDLYPDRGQIHIALFRNVTNSPELRRRLVERDPTLSCALVNASLITQSLRRFGIEDTSRDIVVIKVGGEAAEAEAFMCKDISGDLVPLSQLAEVRDLKRIQKYYQTGGHGDDVNLLMQLVTGAMALKGL
ncbi:hypothetical protein EC973_009393 [Apophysomyces ossiformis]|uniref:EKC/KEOPS complex subunit CGI121 n=1 Tax=Apophysomyces ossiformis TaxID=679940 RepID=A0A8H7BR98_9FUNG|nr:hypothetical protein EC973_009393 [Apophysomyces ossiformis]